MRPPVITVDGPGGTGKGVLCERLAHWLDWNLLDSGALYRLLAAVSLDRRIDRKADGAEESLARLANELDPVFRHASKGGELQVWLAEQDWTPDVRTEACAAAASEIAAFPKVRTALLGRQRAFLVAPGLIADGRDMGTVVFPAADLKIYLTADPAARAVRRHKQLKQKGITARLARLSEDIRLRDDRDRQRQESPMKPASDAEIVDTTGLPN